MMNRSCFPWKSNHCLVTILLFYFKEISWNLFGSFIVPISQLSDNSLSWIIEQCKENISWSLHCSPVECLITLMLIFLDGCKTNAFLQSLNKWCGDFFLTIWKISVVFIWHFFGPCTQCQTTIFLTVICPWET